MNIEGILDFVLEEKREFFYFYFKGKLNLILKGNSPIRT